MSAREELSMLKRMEKSILEQMGAIQALSGGAADFYLSMSAELVEQLERVRARIRQLAQRRAA